MSSTTLSTKKANICFRKARAISPLHTGGPFAVSHDGLRIVTCVQDDVYLTDIQTGNKLCSFQGDSTSPTALCLSDTSRHLAVFTSSNSLYIYDIPVKMESTPQILQPIRHIPRAHDAHVHVCTIDVSSSYLSSGSADGIVKVWDLHRGFVTHIFRGHGGVVSALYFHSRKAQEVVGSNRLTLFTGSVDNRIRMFALSESQRGSTKSEIVFEGHISVPRGIAVSGDGRWLISGGRDSVILVWALGDKTTNETVRLPMKTIPTFECVEALGIINMPQASSENSFQIYTAGEHGIIKLWDVWEGKLIAKMPPKSSSDDEQKEIVQAQYLPAVSVIITLHADHNFVFYSLIRGGPVRQLVGFNDEITDGLFLKSADSLHEDSHFAIATNSALIRIYSLDTYSVQLISGHSNIVLSLDKAAGGQIFASSSKDRTARIWVPCNTTMSQVTWDCVAICEGHTESVGAVAMSRTVEMGTHMRFMFTGSQDKTIKMWDLSSVPTTYPQRVAGENEDPMRVSSLCTHRAHDKDINSLDISPNDKLLASGSQDRTANIYEIDYNFNSGRASGKIRLLGVCKGHKRAVWSVRFSKTERIIATGSSDKTVKLWDIDTFTCLKTFEGHTNSVLRLDFIKDSRILCSAGSDGLVKVWDVQQGECVVSLDNHEDKIWALGASTDERTLVSAGADSVMTFWQDCTEEVNIENEKRREQAVLREQDFANYLTMHDYRNAILLALTMDHPGRLLSLFQIVHGYSSTQEGQTPHTFVGHAAADEVLKALPIETLARLLTHIKSWNASARTSGIAQHILHALLKLRSIEDIASAWDKPLDKEIFTKPSDSNDVIASIMPYTERHLARVEKLVQESWIIDLILNEMDGGLFEISDDDGYEAAEIMDTS